MAKAKTNNIYNREEIVEKVQEYQAAGLSIRNALIKMKNKDKMTVPKHPNVISIWTKNMRDKAGKTSKKTVFKPATMAPSKLGRTTELTVLIGEIEARLQALKLLVRD